MLEFNSNTCSLWLTSVPSLMVLFDLKGVAFFYTFLSGQTVWNLNKPIPENCFTFSCIMRLTLTISFTEAELAQNWLMCNVYSCVIPFI